MKYICGVCGKPTDNDQSFNLLDGEIFEVHRCDKCMEELKSIIEWKNEQFRRDTIICPWCGYSFEEEDCIYEEGEEEIKCPVCCEPIEVNTKVEWKWTTKKPVRLHNVNGQSWEEE